MQKDQSETPKLRRVRRLQKTTTPELLRRNTTVDITTNVRAGSSQHRATMVPSDFPLSQSKNSYLNCSDMELKLLYDQYLQNIMTEIILKKKTEEKEMLFLSQLATISKEYDHNEEKLFKLKTRERDIINLSKIQNEIDSQINDANNCTKEEKKKLQKTLSQLYNLLEPLDKLRCDNIVLPDTPEEWEKTKETLKSCSETLKVIMDLIGTKSESYQSVNKGIKEFVQTLSDIEDNQKELEKNLCNLQALVLKTASLSLMQIHN
ncbi:hypothetical protein WN51_03021 [Melipona quadrifasciata]|uniref:Uncharacterized protein n=1 Tax=Melipona quadrifasciata TaxID=166423 RepID=A0A0M8ZX63_9HYME|nr:hypothetical protein WN51_03021 [Melipona quadrifasciata]